MRTTYFYYLFIFSTILFIKCQSAKILAVIPLAYYSHQAHYRPLFKALAARGHNITLVTSDPMNDPNSTITEIDMHHSYEIMKKYNLDYYMTSKNNNFIELVMHSLNFINEYLEFNICNPEINKILNGDDKYDLVFAEYFLTYPVVFGYKLNCPYIGLLSIDGNYSVHNSVGNPLHPIAYPHYNLPYSTNLSFKERVISALTTALEIILFRFVVNFAQDRIIGKCIGDVPPLEDIQRNVSMVFINANPIFNNIRPWGPATINYGMFHIQKPKPLPNHLQKILDNATKGAIYVSFGSTVKSKSLRNETKQILLETFSELPYTILWKIEEELVDKPMNLYIEKWMPQQDILRHPNIKLFITQGGVHSMEEALYYNVPMIGIPLVGDQFNNVHHMVQKGFGLSADIDTLTKDSLIIDILEVIRNPKYKMKTKELMDIVLDEPMTDIERAVWWTEYVIRHRGAKFLKNNILDLPFYQYYMIDVISFLIVITAVALFILYLIVKLLIKLISLLWKLTLLIFIKKVDKKKTL